MSQADDYKVGRHIEGQDTGRQEEELKHEHYVLFNAMLNASSQYVSTHIGRLRELEARFKSLTGRDIFETASELPNTRDYSKDTVGLDICDDEFRVELGLYTCCIKTDEGIVLGKEGLTEFIDDLTGKLALME